MPEELVIRTMKDDMTDMHASPVVPDIPQQHVKTEGTERPAAKKAPIEKSLVRPEKKNRNIAIGIAYIMLFFLLVGGGAYAYVWWNNNSMAVVPEESVAPVHELIPNDALAVIDYAIDSDEDRTAIASLWARDEQRADIANPSVLLAIPDIDHVYYVLLPDNPRPYLLVKKTENTKQYVASQRQDQIIDERGWYVLHSVDIRQYADALAINALADSSALVPSEGVADYLIQYAFSPVFVSHELNFMASSTIGASRTGGLLFRVMSLSEDNTLRASAHIPGPARGDAAAVRNQELIELIPGDITFSYAGLHFGDDVMKLQNEGSKLDGSVVAQPAVRQFLAQLTAPYAIFERQGADGIRDIGLLVTLPEELRKQIQTGEPIIEQSLPALIPLIIGKSAGIQVAFNDGEYKGVPLRYMNINGKTQALDYVVGDSFILIASSQEGIAALVDTALGNRPGLLQSEEWGDMVQKASAVLEGRQFMVGIINDPALRALLPGVFASHDMQVAVSSQYISTGTDIQAVLSLE